MAHDRSPIHDRKIVYIAPVIIAAVVLIIFGITLSSEPPAPVHAVERNLPSVKSAKPPSPIAPLPALTRNDLIAGAQQAAAVFAADGKLPGGINPALGRPFSIRIAFGCGGALSGNNLGQASSTFDAARQTVTLSVRPGVWTGLPVVQALSNASNIEAVEGFWLPRPWRMQEGCPPSMDYPVPTTPTPPTAQTLGLAQIFTNETSRAGRHAEHPYEFTRKISPGDTSTLGHSYWLILEGHVTGYADGNALHCWMESADHQPLCLYAVTISHVALNDADTGEELAHWSE